MSNKHIEVGVSSEIGSLEAVILHTPGQELQNMTPETAQRSLYSDILNLSVASKEYSQLKGVLDKVSHTFEVHDLLKAVLDNEKVKTDVINKVCTNENVLDLRPELINLSSEELSNILIQGLVMNKNTLTKYLQKEKFSLQPLHNFFFMRDASMTIRNKVLIGKMANSVRKREALIMEAIFHNHSNFTAEIVNPEDCYDCHSSLTIEGGDVLIARDDILLIGTGARTSSQGIDFVIEELKKRKLKKHVIIQELPHSPESFIHLDMVFTFLDKDKCMVYEPIILKQNKYQTISIEIDNAQVKSIKNVSGIIPALNSLGMELTPILCGGKNEWDQEREQWHSGANFFAFAPGKLMGYGRNVYTMEELSKHGFEILRAKDILKNRVNMNDFNKFVVSIEGSELPRGGGGARCMTMPVKRSKVDW